MLFELNIENVAVIEKARIDFGKGLNILTGETGAGKSIVLDSINAILGNRTSKEIVRTGADKAVIIADFEELAPEFTNRLDELGYADGESLIVCREIGADGKNQCHINAKPATAGTLRDICSELINIHGQHDNQELLNPDRHIFVLDKFAGLAPQLEEYTAVYAELGRLRSEIDELTMDEQSKAIRIDLLKFQINEIETAELTDGEDETLSEQKNVMKNSVKLLDSLNRTYKALTGGENSSGALDLVSFACGKLSEISSVSADMEALAARINDYYYTLNEFTVDIRDALESLDVNPMSMEEIEDRLDLINKLKRKYGKTIPEIIEFCENARSELEGIQLAEERLEHLNAEKELVLSHANELAERLSEARKNAFAVFENKIKEELNFLNMPGVRFTVNHTIRELGKLGKDNIEFYISTNPGEPPKPLAKIASGGELARIMLAIKNVLTDNEDMLTLIFDEIDTGVSGTGAQRIGQKLKQAAAARQIICVTHSAQIAAYADTHILVSKTVRDGRTYTDIETLDTEKRVHELARIISGDRITPIALENALEMLTLANG